MPPVRGSLAWVVLIAASALGSSGAVAQDASASLDEEARALFQAGRVAYAAARYEAALARFSEAHELSGRAELLYNIGLCHDRLGHDVEALDGFRRFLAALPNSDNRAEVEQRIIVLERRAANAQEAAAARRQRTEDESPGVAQSSIVPWVLVGAGAALAVGGAILVGVGASDIGSVNGAPDGTAWMDVASTADRGGVLVGVGVAGIGVGVALAAVGIVWAATAPGGEQASVAIALGARGGVVEVTF